MNAKKIMGAVLVALLAAALFVGAGAAAPKDVDGQTVFVYQPVTGLDGTWTLGGATITATAYSTTQGYFSGDNIAEGTYKNGDYKITVKYPTATISGVAEVKTDSSIKYMILGGTYYKGDVLELEATPAVSGFTVGNIIVTYPNGTVVAKANPWDVEAETDLPLGKYTVQGKFTVPGEFVAGTPVNYFNSKETFTFTVASSTDITISAETESVIESGAFSVTVYGKPGSKPVVQASDKFTFVSENGVAITQISADNEYTATIQNTGKTVLYMKAGTDTGSGKIKAGTNSVTITVVAGTITAAAEKDSYFIGDEIKLTGTSTAGNALNLYIAGTNVKLTNLDKDIAVKSDGTWSIKVTTDEISAKVGKKLDAGTYTIYVSNKDTNALDDLSNIKTYTTVTLPLKQPFISVTDAPTVAVKGTEYVVTGIAEASSNGIKAYIFGTNYFAATTNIGAKLDMSTSIDDNVFTIEVDIPATSSNMSTGQYFMVIQHPMYDGLFNIQADDKQGIWMAPTVKDATGKPALDTTNTTVLFDVTQRQNANAAQALCDALDSQNIDDMYVKLSFIVANPESTINPIPSEITQGSKLTVSGSTNMGKGKLVTVEMLASAFAAVPKDTVGSASFIALTAETDENGNWEVTFDTTGLNQGEYIVSASVEQIGETNAKINVIEGAPTENPTEQPTQTEQPTEQPTQTEAPATPGFGALAALAGLGAVAVLLLRRE